MFFPLLSLILLLTLLTSTLFFCPQPSMLSLLFILEAATLSSLITLFLFFWLSLTTNPYLMFIFITFSACGASLGLAILVSKVRFWGSDTPKTPSFILC